MAQQGARVRGDTGQGRDVRVGVGEILGGLGGSDCCLFVARAQRQRGELRELRGVRYA